MGLSRSDFVAGVRDIALAIPGPFSVALIASVAAVGAGLTAVQGYAMIGLTFAGASQLAALELLTDGATLAVVVLTALVINARFAIFSASLAPHFRDQSAGWRWLLGAVVSTPAAVVSLAQFAGDTSVDARSYYLGAALTMWGTWQVGTVVGLVVGARLPTGLGLEFVVPLVFIGLLFQTVEGRPSIVAGGVGGAVALVGSGLPLGLGFVVGAVTGVLAGVLAHWRWVDGSGGRP